MAETEFVITLDGHFSYHLPGPLLADIAAKVFFALLIKNSPGCRRDFRVKMWGTSSPDDKLTGDLGNVIEATQIGGRRSDRLMAGKLSPGNFGLLQQYRHKADISSCLLVCPLSMRSRHRLAIAYDRDSLVRALAKRQQLP
jgi:hypothetical protein